MTQSRHGKKEELKGRGGGVGRRRIQGKPELENIFMQQKRGTDNIYLLCAVRGEISCLRFGKGRTFPVLSSTLAHKVPSRELADAAQTGNSKNSHGEEPT